MATASLLDTLRERLPAMVDALEAIVTIESPSPDVAAVARCADAVTSLGEELLRAQPERIERDGRPHLRWRFGDTRLVLIGHLDTVHPIGTIDRSPFAVRDRIAAGPGTLDMKSGIVMGMFALAELGDLEGVTLLITSDEELGSPTSESLIRETAEGAAAALVLEPAHGDALKIARKGVSDYTIEIAGKEAHAGLEPERGVNALIELAHQVLALEATADRGAGTTVTPTVAHAGSATNVVPAEAMLRVDVRCAVPEEQRRVDDAVRALVARLPGARVEVRGGPNRPPMPESASAELFGRARRLASGIGLGELRGVAVGGGSDGNFTAAIGVPTLDGLGGVGDGAHARSEYVRLDSLAERGALLGALIDDIRSNP